ncbi:hypothetical protein [Vibrio parahaemolyticus]|uniref:hypothetical protein n=1 Tax=Vibrio parahaemolyticus TaxID=670 RepID=UPI0012922532|nr:hypothetical protein [Vibrio parahaemolyticus]MCR9778944.1 hypothetical protein [Vibrio parahaemolyticus]MCR9886929.1 hypothetical protein [Vibrio parahaemolyticus]MCR9915891.1 hypothetical protein [Vibrio parahaemolyticus]MCX8784124.1 hypothetical protein [Vibrio parahaemolyticus]MCX8789009.1 hypothetical protein [Vibrio parahaemolyticus]
MPHNFLDRKKKPLSSSGGGYKPLHEEESLRKPQAREETVRERAARQRRERQAELTYTQEDYARWERNRKRRQLEVEAQKAIEELLIFLPALDLETSVHSQAVKEFSEAFDVILKGYNGDNISYETGYDLIHQVKNGFIEGGGALRKVEENRLSRQTEKADNFSQDGSYRRNLVVNDESFNVRFKASCATPECLMRNANIDMEDDAFQDYIEAATQDKRSDVMQVIGVALIANPYLKPLEYVVFGDVAYAGLKDKNLDPLWAYLMGRGAYYRLHLLSVSKRVKDTSENVVSYFSGSVLSSD